MHQVNNLAIGGVETFVYRLCKYSNEDVFVYSHLDGIVREWMEDASISVYLQRDYDISYLIKYLHIDVFVMHTGSYLPDYAQELKRQNPDMKFVQVLHTVYTSTDEWVDKIICISKAVYDVNNPEKSILIYPGIDRRKRFVVGEITRIAPYKYLEDLVKIAKLVVAENPEVLFKVIGEDAQDSKGYTELLKHKIKEEGLESNFEFMGYVDKIDWNWFDAFVHLVGDEAYPVTILEALNKNLPTFTYEKRGTSEINHPQLFKSNSLEWIAKNIIKRIDFRPKHIKQVADEFSGVYNSL